MNSNDYWGHYTDWIWGEKPPVCIDNLSYNDCVNLCTPRSCKHRMWLETNPFTRPMRSAAQKEAAMYFDLFSMPLRISHDTFDWEE